MAGSRGVVCAQYQLVWRAGRCPHVFHLQLPHFWSSNLPGRHISSSRAGLPMGTERTKITVLPPAAVIASYPRYADGSGGIFARYCTSLGKGVTHPRTEFVAHGFPDRLFDSCSFRICWDAGCHRGQKWSVRERISSIIIKPAVPLSSLTCRTIIGLRGDKFTTLQSHAHKL